MRESVIIYFKNSKIVQDIEKTYSVVYTSKKNKYSIIFIDSKDVDKLIKKYKYNKIVRYVDKSRIFTEKFSFDALMEG